MITGRVPVTIIAMPRAMLSEPSVIRNEGMRSLVVKMPLTKPMEAPVSRPARAPTIQVCPMSLMASAATTPDRAMLEPTDRSNSPETITKVMPTAMIETSAVCRPTLAKFAQLRNTGELSAKIAMRTRNPT